MAKDQFADIAAGYHVDQERGLISPGPRPLDGRTFSLQAGGEAFAYPEKIRTKEQLDRELDRMREQYRPFLQDFAPPQKEMVSRVELKEFTYSLDGGLPEKVTLPHYQGPRGEHRAEYTTEFELDALEEEQRVWIRCLGVDYLAEVFVNGDYAGCHEGFFAPFSFDITHLVQPGNNRLKIVVKNDFVMGGNDSSQGHSYGDKIYAATGPGWDDPEVGWHHCPPGMGIYNKVFVEVQPETVITDLFPRVNDTASELWVDCHSSLLTGQEVSFSISVYGQNFQETVYENHVVTPSTSIAAGVGDTLTRARLIASGQLGAGTPLLLERGCNTFVLPISIPNPRIWSPQTPWLYQVQVAMLIEGKVVSAKSCQFGVRTFTQDKNSQPKGKFYLNGQEIRLRGANTMGFEQQDVMREDWDQLIDDILLAKICHMNFLRITQRPVQQEIYDYCDRLGLMIQTDLPMFGCLKINQYCEAIRQAGEMERLIRSHPCCILDSYINEPFPNAKNMPQCMVNRGQLMNFFQAADDVVHMMNPDRVTKHVDGDYDPPSESLPDNHCYSLWYNGHGLDFGKLHKGYWLDVKPGWCYGCGEFGAEGLDFVDLMERRYPKEWIRPPFDPANIVGAQTAPFHYCFYETPHSMEEWVSESHRHQYFATKMMTAAMRRNPNVNTFAIHLFIDAFPSGWMKTIMDCERHPKPAYFAYRDCLEPVFCNIRSDRFTFFGGEKAELEAYLCCDGERPEKLRFFAELDGKVIASGEEDSREDYFQGKLFFSIPCVDRRSTLRVTMGAFSKGTLVQYTQESFSVFPEEKTEPLVLLSYEEYQKDREGIEQKIRSGETVTFAPLEKGCYEICGKEIRVTECRMHPLYVVSRDTGHPLVEGFAPNDFGWWYDSKEDRIVPLIYATFEAEQTEEILTTGNKDDDGEWRKKLACAQWSFGAGTVRICQVDLSHKEKNPVAAAFCNRLAKGQRA
ncbi:MAG: glycoside hydrolase family 2 TIM barrel-domain containing protein [Clostridia bacterium]|nr:glycoside hydrolase family 2 TIM barrel-domain containing protein [Clostridia bacterium]